MPARRFPPPWTVEELDACFVVRDHSGQRQHGRELRRRYSGTRYVNEIIKKDARIH
jgi:hypothetical protein